MQRGAFQLTAAQINTVREEFYRQVDKVGQLGGREKSAAILAWMALTDGDFTARLIVGNRDKLPEKPRQLYAAIRKAQTATLDDLNDRATPPSKKEQRKARSLVRAVFAEILPPSPVRTNRRLPAQASGSLSPVYGGGKA